ncbi:MAG: hypothetical protein M3Z07_04280 [Candidatus Eremiobacteraeota bacterium]|nr:hypothetical protein [Candidatus Eremiobacteraeota bacterium]
MIGLSHIVLHVALCKSVARISQETPVSIHAVMAYRIRKPEMDEVFRVVRESPAVGTLEFDAPQGVYRLSVDVPHKNCSGTDYVVVLPDHDRQLSLKLSPGRSALAAARAFVAGDAAGIPSYLEPTIVLFGRGLACNATVTRPTNERVDLEFGSGAYYAAIYSEAAMSDSKSRVVALRLTDTGGGYHYVRIPTAFPRASNDWPSFERFNLTMDIAELTAGKPEDTLLCPHLFRTSVGG